VHTTSRPSDPRATVVDAIGARLQRREVGAGVGLREELAPDLARVEDRRQEPRLLLVGAVREQRRTREVDPDPVDRLQRPRSRVLHVEDRDLDRRRAPPAVLRGPVDPDPTAGRELRLPGAPELDLVGDRGEPGRHLHVIGEPRADLHRERLLLGREREIHQRSQKRSRW